jgi:hypothetical protein
MHRLSAAWTRRRGYLMESDIGGTTADAIECRPKWGG